MSIMADLQRGIESAYGKPLAEVEAAVERLGKRAVGFGCPSTDQRYLSLFAGRWTAGIKAGNHNPMTRLFIADKPPREWRLKETGEVRKPVYGDWYLREDGVPYLSLVASTFREHPILRLTEVTDDH